MLRIKYEGVAHLAVHDVCLDERGARCFCWTCGQPTCFHNKASEAALDFFAAHISTGKTGEKQQEKFMKCVLDLRPRRGRQDLFGAPTNKTFFVEKKGLIPTVSPNG